MNRKDGLPLTFHVKTYGCQMNERDSEGIRAALAARGMEQAETEDAADLVIVNTCSVRGKAEDKAIGKLGLLAASKRERPDRIVGAAGCMVQRLGRELLDRVPDLDFAVGTFRLGRVGDVVAQVRTGKGPVLDVADTDERVRGAAAHEQGRLQAFVSVMFGCDRRCAYCIVPSVRGPESSRSPESIVKEVRELVETGTREVTLLGQSVTSYGRRQSVWPTEDVSPRGFSEPLPRLLEAVAGVPGLSRLRFTSNHPFGCTGELAAAMASLPPLCEHLHLPLQSGSDRLLGLMRRGYDADDYRRAVERLRDAMPGLALTTDVIVGFPTETEQDFESTRRMMREIGFDNAFIFKYSPRPGTAAASWKDDVPDPEKRRRNKQLLADQDAMGLELNRKQVGRTVEVLVEGESLRDRSHWCGRTRTNKIVIFDPVRGVKVGDLAHVQVQRARAQTLYGRVDAAGGGKQG